MKISSKKTIGILGSGFGLYGYLVALREGKFKNPIYTLAKYKKIFSQRKDIAKYQKNIFFCKDERDVIDRSYYLIFAKRPLDQQKFLNKILNKKKELFIEKPIATTPKKSIEIIKLLKKNKIKFKIGFLFYYQDWFQKLIKSNNQLIKINWNFYSSDLKKKKNTWKINDQIPGGGGIINFYGIHFIFLITFLGKIKNIKSKLIYNKKKLPVKWNLHVTFYRNKELFLNISIDNNENLFKISTNNKKNFYIGKSPFKNSNYNDLRIKSLILHFLNRKNFDTKYLDHINIWKKIINSTKKINE